MSATQDQRELNKQIVKRLLMECFSGGHIEVLDEIISPDFEFEYPNLPPSIEGLKALVKKNNESFQGWQFSIHDMLADGDKVALRWSASGVHVKSFLGEPPSGGEVRLKGQSIYQLKDGLIWKDWVEPDNLGFMTQLGLVAPVDFLAEDR